MTVSAPITLGVTADPKYARLVRMTAANVAMLSSMSVDRVEDVRMAAEEAFIYACSVAPGSLVDFKFLVDDEHVEIVLDLGSAAHSPEEVEGPAAYVDLILSAVTDYYEKTDEPTVLRLGLRADV